MVEAVAGKVRLNAGTLPINTTSRLGLGCPPKLVSPLSETKRLFQLLRFYTKTESFGVLNEPKQTEEQPKQCDREHIFGIFFTKFRVVLVCFGLFWFVSKQFVSVVSVLYRNREFRCFF
jgi:hypothetical protein